jgi:putative transposase
MPNYKRVFADNHYIFITSVTFKRNPILIDNIDILRSGFNKASKKFKFEIYSAVILPDHFHVIIGPENIAEYPQIITTIKQNFSQNVSREYIEPVRKFFTSSMVKRNESGVWQRRYYEHTIRNEKDLYNHLDYIHFNPVKHGIAQNVKDWKFSSFYKFVEMGYYNEDWGCSEDIKHIEDIDAE